MKIYLMWGPHQSPFIFVWINFVNSINKNYENKFTLILKHFENQRKFESGSPKRKWQPNLIKNEMLIYKNPKDGKFDNLKSLKKPEVRKSFQNGVGNYCFEIKGKEFEGVAHGSISGHARGGHAYLPQRFDWVLGWLPVMRTPLTLHCLQISRSHSCDDELAFSTACSAGIGRVTLASSRLPSMQNETPSPSTLESVTW